MPTKKTYNHEKVEKKWQKKWREDKTYEPSLSASRRTKKPFYNLMMFPYPSAEGLHVGNMYAFTGSDIYGRFKRMQGYDVFEPIGLDGFGIHSENYALKIGAHPADQAKVSEKRFYKQLEAIGNGFAWEERLETYDPKYYRWTQWIFIQMFKHGLAYRKKAAVNWCPSDKTVLADEQVINGICERCGAVVEKKELEQWFFKITDYAERLLNNLEKIDWSERVKIAQRNWIGRSEGALIKFPIQNFKFPIEVFTTRIDTIFSGTFVIIAPESPMLDSLKSGIKNWNEIETYRSETKKVSDIKRTDAGRQITGVELKGIQAINPATGEKISVWIADFVLAHYGTGAVFADAHDTRDFEMAKKYNIPLKISLRPKNNELFEKIKNLEECYEGEGILCNSDQFDGLTSAEARPKIIAWLEQKGLAKSQVNYKLRDWLISRQRYWGPPIPMIHCDQCGWQPVPEENLPVKLPYIEDFRPRGTGESPLASVESFYQATCPKCGGAARRETDVSDTFLDSAWYFLRYPSVNEKNNPWDKGITKQWLPVNRYIGGAEHSVLHLLYSRFMTMVFHDWGLLDFEEPFTTFRAHGLLIKEGGKMSKSKGNVVNPDEYIEKFGADALRMYLMFLAPFEQGGDFRDAGIFGIVRFLDRVYNLKMKIGGENDTLQRVLHQTIKKVTEDIETLHYNTAVSALMVLLRACEDQGVAQKDYETFLKLLAPLAPHLAEECWSRVGHSSSIHKESWPAFDPRLVETNDFELVIQVNGKLRGKVTANRGISQQEAEHIAERQPVIVPWLKKGSVQKIIFVPDRLINFIVK